MRRAILPLLTLSLVALAFVLSVSTRLDEPERIDVAFDEPDPATGAMLLDLDDDADADDRRRIGEKLDRAIAPFAWDDAVLGETLSESAQLHRLQVPPSEIADVQALLRGDEDVEGLELERIWTLPETETGFSFAEHAVAAGDPEPTRGPFKPNDPYYKHQWHLDQIQMPEAWVAHRGQGVVVAIIDTGVLTASRGRFKQAPDLQGTQFAPGHDFVDNDDQPDDGHGHGTHVAGTVAQATNNGLGVAGVAPEATIMPIRVLDDRGAGSWGSVAAGIRWAADHGAHVINLSLGGGTPSSAIRNAIAHAHSKGVVVVAAAGNTGRGRVQYPAAHRFAVAVGAVRYDETLSFYSSYGTRLDVVAPGGDLRVDQNGDGLPDGVIQNTMLRGNPAKHDYLGYQGTSMAAPHVAGVAALVRGAGVTDPDAIERILKATAKSKSDERRYGSGLIQANDALKAAKQGAAGTRGGFAFGLGALLLLGLGRRRSSAFAVLPAIAVAVVTAGGLGVMCALVPESMALLLAPLSALSLGSPVLALLLGLLVPIAAAGIWAQRPTFAVGLSLGVAGWLMAEAVLPTFMAAAWMGPVLVVEALLACLLARQLAHR